MDTITAQRRPTQTKRAFAARLRMSPPALADLETREREGRVTLAALQRYAAALDCEVELRVVPRRRRPSEVLAANREQVLQLLRRSGVTGALVFGSAARGEDTVDSDLDLLVEFADEMANSDELCHQLRALLGVPVDLLDSASTASALVNRVVREGVPV